MNDQRFLAIFDAHIGFEAEYTSSDGWKAKPAHDLKFLSLVWEFAKDFKPDKIIFGGDQLNFDQLSRWRSGQAVSEVQDSVRKECKLAEKLLLEPARETGGELIWFKGNHDIRPEVLMAKTPSLTGLLEIKNIINLEDVKIVEQGGIYKLGKLHFIHGDTIKSTSHPAKKMVEYYGVNIRCGHFHRYEAATLTRRVEPTHPITGIVMPCACHRNPAYLNNSPNSWCQGIGYGYVSKNGNFADYVAVRTPNGLVINGKTYA